MGSGTNFHRSLPVTSISNKAPCKFTFNDKNYELKPEHLFLQEKWFDFLLKGPFKKKRFVSIIDEKTGAIVKLTEQEDISSEDLMTAQESQALGKAISQLFRDQMPSKKILFFIIIGVVAVVVFLVLSGQINLGGIMK